MSFPRRSLLLPLLGWTLLQGCSSSRPSEALPPPPPPSPLLASFADAPSSTLRIPIVVDLQYAAQRTLQALPKPLARDTIRKQVQVALPGGFGYSPAVGATFRQETQLEGLDLRLDGDTLTATADVGFKVGGSLDGGGFSMGVGSCGERPGEPSAGIRFVLKGRLSWGADGQVDFSPQPWNLRWTRPCELTAFRIRLEDILNLPLVRTKVAGAVDAAIRRLSDNFRLRPVAEQAWASLSKPFPVQPGMYLSARPDSLFLGPLRGSGKTLSTSLLVHARPWITSDSVAEISPLPPLRVDSSPDMGFRLDVQGLLPLANVDSAMSRLLRTQTLQAGGKPVRIASSRLYASGGHVVVAVRFEEPFRGEVFLRGVPEFDSLTNAVRFAKLDFDLASRNFLVKTASSLLHGTIRDQIAKAAVFPLDRFLEPLRDMRIPIAEGTSALVSVGRLRPLGISLTDSTLQAWVRAEGKAAIQVGSR
jgi:hypothetical protein